MSLNATPTNKTQLPIAMLLLSITTLATTLTSITILTGTILASNTVLADDNTSVVDEINITVPISCTISGTGMNTHNAEINNGQYNSAIGETTLKAFCNDNEGFAIYAIGYTDNEDGKNVLTNSTLGSTYDIETGTAITGNDSQWAMKLSTITSPTPTYPIIIAGSTDDTEKEQGDPDYSTFQEVPDDYALVAKRTAGTDIGANAEGATLKSTYQAYISKTQPAGTYTGQVKYTLVHPHNATKPTKPVTIATAEYLQEVNSCPADLPEEQIYTLKDSRDEQEYKAAKLKDGKCWLLDNLVLDPTDPTVAANMNETNTNASATAILNYLNGGNPNNTAGWSSTPVSDIDTNFSVGGYTVPRINNASKDALVTGYGPAATDGQSKVGIYYNFCAASVGTYCYEENQGEDSPDTIIDAPEDICPAGWRMPTGGDIGEYFILAEEYGDDASDINSLQFRLSATLSGSYMDSSAAFLNNVGFWWSSTRNDSSHVYGLSVFPTNVVPNNDYYGSNRNWGDNIRCLLKTQP